MLQRLECSWILGHHLGHYSRHPWPRTPWPDFHNSRFASIEHENPRPPSGGLLISGACACSIPATGILDRARTHRAEVEPSNMSDWIGPLKQSFAELRRRRVFRVAAVYIVVSWGLIQLAGATFEPLGLPLWTNRLLIVLLALGFVLVCILA